MKNIKSKDIRSQTSLCESSARLLLIEEQSELLSAAMLAGIHTLTHCENIIPETADMWQAGEHLNTVALCDRSLQGPQEIIQDHSPDTMARSAVAMSLLKSLLNLLLQTTQKLHSQQSIPMSPSPTVQKHVGMLPMDGTCTTGTTNRGKLIFPQWHFVYLHIMLLGSIFSGRLSNLLLECPIYS